MDTGNKAMIRDMNTNFILKTIIESKAISRADIAKQSGLTKATVSAIVRLLLDRGLVTESGIAMTDKGRKPIILKFCPEVGCTLSFEIGRSKISMLAANLAGQTLYTSTCATPSARGRLLPLLENIIENISGQLPDTAYGIVGICIGVHGIVNNDRISFTPYHPYSDMDLKTPLESRFNIPVHIENEANLSVIAEQCYHFDCDSLVAMSIHSGIGLGIILDGHLYSGTNGCAGEFGHSTVELNGRPCPCGNRGCLEQYASELAILTDYKNALQLNELPEVSTLIENYKRGDPWAVSVIGRFTDYTAAGINNILGTLNPELIVINSSFTAALPQLTDEIMEKLPSRIRRLCLLKNSALGSDSVLLGGACLAMKNFLGFTDIRLEGYRQQPAKNSITNT